MTGGPTGTAVVVLAAGSGTRAGHARNKVLMPLRGRPVLVWSLLTAREVRPDARLVVVVRSGEEADVADALAGEPALAGVEVVVGGASRHASEQAALEHLAPEIRAGTLEVVALHDGARPRAGADLFRAVLDEAAAGRGAVPGRARDDLLDRGGRRPDQALVAVETPQAFPARALLDAYAAAAADGWEGTDTAACLERYADLEVVAVPSPAGNVKITYPDDLAALASAGG